MHSVLFFDALIAHVRFDGLCSVDLLPEVGRVCGFEEGECTLCWAGPFPTFIGSAFKTPTADWLISDSKTGVKKSGKYDMSMLEYKKPSECTHILDMLKKKDARDAHAARLLFCVRPEAQSKSDSPKLVLQAESRGTSSRSVSGN